MSRNAKHATARARKAAEVRASHRSAICRSGTSTTSMPASTTPEIKRDLDAADGECVAFEQAFKGRLAEMAAARRCRAGAGRGGQALRGARGPARPADLLCLAGLCRQHHRSRARQVLWRHAGAHHRRLARICCSSRSSSTASTTPRSMPPWPIRRSAITGRGSRTCARRSPISSRTASSSCSTRSR